MSRVIRVGLVGCGAIGTHIAKILNQKFRSKARLVYANDLVPARAEALARFVDLKTLVRKSDLVIEAAHLSCVKELVSEVMRHGKSALIMSVGGLLDVRRFGSKGTLYIPSGAVAGIDALSAAKQDGIKKVTLITRKPIAGLQGSSLLAKKGKIKGETILFEGSAEAAVKAFPQNVNVAAVVSLATIGAKRVRVKVITSPKFKRNSHEIVAEGRFGRIRTLTENVPSAENPKTSALAQHSVTATLEKIFGRIKIGT